MRLTAPVVLSVAGALLLLLAPEAAQASYMGPGLGLGVISTALAVIGAVFMALVAIVWYPVKRAVRGLRRRKGG
jgi:hypothetical protein